MVPCVDLDATDDESTQSMEEEPTTSDEEFIDDEVGELLKDGALLKCPCCACIVLPECNSYLQSIKRS
jgi:hypothetical protein